jgi:GNAT superfamily N-acetyltransferase
MADARPELEFLPTRFLPDFHVYVLEEDGQIVGFCGLIPMDHETVELYDLFVEPSHIGKGYGKQLWDYAVGRARESGFRKLVLTADPNAESFYTRQGAVRTGEKPSAVRTDRMLPVMEYRITENFSG